MNLRGTEFGHVFNSSGARGFDGGGYWFHRLFDRHGLNYKGSTFVAKTTTLTEREGNMPLDRNWQPISKRPDCIVVKPWSGVVLNAVGLSGPGSNVLRLTWLMKQRTSIPFVISFMPVEKDVNDRKSELEVFLQALPPEVKFNNSVALQLNFSCPNVKANHHNLIKEVKETVRRTMPYSMPVMVKLNALVSPLAACEIADTKYLDAIVCSNTIPWGQLPDKIDWKKLFGSNKSPLEKYGGGGLSGKPLLPIVCQWLQAVNTLGIMKPLVAGGGILSKKDADLMIQHGADAIELGSVSILRPWRVQGIIQHVNKHFEDLNAKHHNP